MLKFRGVTKGCKEEFVKAKISNSTHNMTEAEPFQATPMVFGVGSQSFPTARYADNTKDVAAFLSLTF